MSQLIGICKDCIFWKPDDVNPVGKCTALSHGKLKMWPAEVCECEANREIWTEGDFGCTQWEGKP